MLNLALNTPHNFAFTIFREHNVWKVNEGFTKRKIKS